MSPYSICLAVALVLTFHITDSGQTCGVCSHIASPMNCDTVAECSDHEVCAVTEYLSPAGYKFYDVGCESAALCHVGKRSQDIGILDDSLRSSNINLCTSCCNDTKLCNVINGHCNSQVLDMTDLVLCYHCDYMDSPGHCDKVTACSKHQKCLIERKPAGLTGSLLWTSRCGHENKDCGTTGIPITGVIGKKRASGTCSSCCTENLCNNQCPLKAMVTPTSATNAPTTFTTASTTPMTTRVPLSAPVITFVSRVHNVHKGTYQHLTCRANGNPTPTITWNFYALGDVKPTNVRVGNNGADIYIDSVTDQNYGHYACKARNSQGDDTRYVDVLEHGPNGP